MAEQNARLVYVAAKLTGAGTARAGVFACRYLGSSYGDPLSPFVTDSNEWYELTEDAGTTNSYFYGDLPKGKYRLQLKDDSGSPAVYTTIGHYENIHHSTPDLENHINDDDPDMRHNATAIVFTASATSLVSLFVSDAIEEIAGTGYDPSTDDSLVEHLDDTTAAHAASAISCTVGATTDVESALDDHETRITALETGTAATPTGIDDVHGDMGIDIEWNAQDVAGIEYAFRYLWKHTSESVPATYADLEHNRRELAPETTVFYRSRRFDLSSNPNTDLVLYYAVGAKGRADASFTWSAVQSIEVTLPTYTQEFSGVLNGLSVCTSGGAASVYGLYSEILTSDENWPTGSESGGAPTGGYQWLRWDDNNVTVTGIEIESETALSGDVTMNYRSETTGTSGTFTITSADRRGSVSGLSLPITANDELQLWTTDPKGIGHWRVRVWFTRS